MTIPSLGKQLEAAGWDQGILLPALSYCIVYDPNNPFTKIARSPQKISIDKAGLTTHGLAFGPMKPKERLVVISQACDIVASPETEPYVVTMRAFFTENDAIMRSAGSNSIRRFLLDPARNLVVDATIQVLVEKPLLLTVSPETGAPSEAMRRRFARWLGQRYDRPPQEDVVVDAVIKPILENLHAMKEAGDPDLAALDTIKEVRHSRFTGDPPYDINLVFITPDDGLIDGGVALARLVGRMSQWFTPGKARLAGWDARSLYEISAGEFLDTDRLFLDHYTYRGETILGLDPPPTH